MSAADGLITSLDASEGWLPPSGALQLSYEFGFIDDDAQILGDGGLPVAMATVTNDVPRAEIILPRGMSVCVCAWGY